MPSKGSWRIVRLCFFFSLSKRCHPLPLVVLSSQKPMTTTRTVLSVLALKLCLLLSTFVLVLISVLTNCRLFSSLDDSDGWCLVSIAVAADLLQSMKSQAHSSAVEA